MKLIDNFFKEYDFKNLVQQVVWNANFPMYLRNFVSYASPDAPRPEGSYEKQYDWFAIHILFHEGKVRSPLYPYLSGLLKPLLKWKTLLRLKINFYGHTDKINEHSLHTDFDFKHKGFIFYINTNNGFTKLKDGTKIKSVANRGLYFDSAVEHNSSTCTGNQPRINININYI